mmetsp:Transcript_37411/g.75513  ORF Transcript_37411/g.75513 Transcript_37411/m.75513 type:complete len:339 (-) Transcript_37411:38-1054(-)
MVQLEDRCSASGVEEPSVILKCVVVDTGDVMRLRIERPLSVERVQKLIGEAIGPALVAKHQDPAGELHSLTDENLAELTGPVVRLRLYGRLPNSPRIALQSAGPLVAVASVGQVLEAGTAPAPVAKDQRRRQRQQAHRKQRKELKTKLPEEQGSAEAGCAEQPAAEGEEEDASGDEVPTARAVDIYEGMELWVESGVTKRLLQVFQDGHVDFNGGPEASAAFTVKGPAAGANESTTALQGPGGCFLRQCEGGALDCCGASADDWECRFSFVDVVEGVVLFLGPSGSGHVCAALGSEAPQVGREAAPQAFRLFAPRPGPEPPGSGIPTGSSLQRWAAAE